MKKPLFLLLATALVAMALWVGMRKRDQQIQESAAAQADDQGYAFEAEDVVLQQMGPDGRQQFQLAARRVVQSPATGEVIAEDLTMHHDPPGTVPGGPHRWTLTASAADLPADGRMVTLRGSVTARGLPRGRKLPIQFTTSLLTYDLATQELATDAEVSFDWGQTRIHGRQLRANLNTSTLALE